MRRAFVTLFAVALSGGGCIIVNNTPTDHHTGAGGTIPDVGTLTVYRIKSGESAVIQPGTQAGYAITATAPGNGTAVYRLVWTGDAGTSNTYREFWGSVWAPNGGHFSGLAPGCTDNSCPLESDDFVSGYRTDASGADRIDFDTFATTGIDGFDVTTNVEPIVFDLYIDGGHYPSLVNFFSTDNNQLASTATIPFGLTTN